MFPKLEKWYEWLKRTQGGMIPYGFHWRGRTENHTLPSGLDDYPRNHGSPSMNELHLDLLCWMMKAAKILSDIAETIGKPEKAQIYQEDFDKMLRVLEEVHWSEEYNAYLDVLYPSVHVNHIGYVSLFPFLLSLIPSDSPRLGSILQSLRDPQLLWSCCGLRSLAKSDAYFGTDENYWRGPIWVNINYLALQSLYHSFVKEDSPGASSPYREDARNIYQQLRKNLIDNVFINYKRSGYVWEQYNGLDGHGERSHPFTGWSALVVAIMAEKY